MVRFSVIIPVYNRPEEMDELLESLSLQTWSDFEVIVVEDGSQRDCQEVVEKYHSKLQVYYFRIANSGPGLARNYGIKKANEKYFVFFDSDCIIPANYFQQLADHIQTKNIDAFGGPDQAHWSFSPLQKAINYSMTSILTSGGIRGNERSVEKFKPRSFNMGFKYEIFKKTGGFSSLRFGEDIDLSLKIMDLGFTTTFLKDNFVYHKRRIKLIQFFKQVFNSGMARVYLGKIHPGSMKPVHVLPTLFIVGLLFLFFLSLFFDPLILLVLVAFVMIILIHSLITTKNFGVAFLSVITSFIQLIGYGCGFIYALAKGLLGKGGYAFEKSFYR